MKRRKGYYSISVVAKMFDVHQQTIRLYEKEGLINPKRSEGGTRMFAEEDVDRLEEIIYLTHKMGVNIAGVEMILKLQRKMKKMQDDMNKLFSATNDELEEETKQMKSQATQAAKELLSKRIEHQPITAQLPEPSNSNAPEDDWEVEYDEE